MSRIGQKPVDVPSGVTAAVDGNEVRVKGPKGEMSIEIPGRVTVTVGGSQLVVGRADDSRQAKSFHGLVRTLIANAIEGVSKGYMRELEIEGVGFRAAVKGKTLELSLGFANPKIFDIPDTVKVEEQGGTKIVVSGVDKQQVGEVAARIRGYYPAEPYKGKGLKYKGERIRRKEGKTVA